MSERISFKTGVTHLPQELLHGRKRRGTETINTEDEAYKEMIEHQKQDTIFNYFGTFALPKKMDIKQILVLGKTGSGKTVLISDYISQLIERGEKVIINDVKGDFVTMFYRPGIDHIFNPYDDRCLRWNIFNDIDEAIFDTEVDTITTNIASSIVPMASDGGNEKFWLIGTRLIIKALYDFVYYYAPNTIDKKLRCNDIVYKLAQLDFVTLRNVVAQVSPKLEDIIPVAPESQSGDGLSGQAAGVLGHLTEHLAVLKDLSRIDGDFSIKKWISGEIKGNIFVTSFESIKEALKPSLSLFINLIILEILSLPDDLNRRIYMVLDEFGALQKLPAIIDGLILGRSKGLSILIAGQDLQKIQETYGNNLTKTLINACNTKIILGTADVDTANTFSGMFGEHEVYQTKISLTTNGTEITSKNEGVDITSYKTVTPSEILNLKELHFFASIGDGYVYQGKGIIKNLPKNTCERFIPFGKSMQNLNLLFQQYNTENEEMDKTQLKNTLLSQKNKKYFLNEKLATPSFIKELKKKENQKFEEITQKQEKENIIKEINHRSTIIAEQIARSKIIADKKKKDYNFVLNRLKKLKNLLAHD